MGLSNFSTKTLSNQGVAISTFESSGYPTFHSEKKSDSCWQGRGMMGVLIRKITKKDFFGLS